MNKIKNAILLSILAISGSLHFGVLAQNVNVNPSQKSDASGGIFGFSLGTTTIEDIKTSCKISRVECAFESLGSGYLSHAGKDIFVNLKNISDSQKLEIIEFNGADELLTGKFLDGVLFELTVRPRSEYEFSDREFIKVLLQSFDKKYKRSKTIKGSEAVSYSKTNYVYENWIERSGEFSVELRESREFILNQATCLAVGIGLTGSRKAASEFRCAQAIQPPTWKLTYFEPKLRLQAWKMVEADSQKKVKADDTVKTKKAQSY